MRLLALVCLFAFAPLAAESWPCVSRRSPDRSLVDVAEATGGQVILAEPGEIEKTTFLHIQRMSHGETVFRSTGELFNETREFRFPVDSTIESLLVSVMLACKGEIAVLTGQGIEPEAEGTEFKGGRVARVVRPQPGEWRLRLRGKGFYSIVVEAKTSIQFAAGNLAGHALRPVYRLTGDEGQTLMRLDGPPQQPLDVSYPRYRIAIEGVDDQGFPFQRLTRHMILTPESPKQP